MQILLAVAVLLSVGSIVSLWLRRARRVQLAKSQVRASLQRDRSRLGADPQQPIRVSSSAEIEPRAERQPCPWCEGALHVAAHEVVDAGPDRLRRVDASCGGCGRTTTTWFTVETAPLKN